MSLRSEYLDRLGSLHQSKEKIDDATLSELVDRLEYLVQSVEKRLSSAEEFIHFILCHHCGDTPVPEKEFKEMREELGWESSETAR